MKDLIILIKRAKEMLEMKKDTQDFRFCDDLEFTIRKAERILNSKDFANETKIKQDLKAFL